MSCQEKKTILWIILERLPLIRIEPPSCGFGSRDPLFHSQNRSGVTSNLDLKVEIVE
jgi:hypothetical protein